MDEYGRFALVYDLFVTPVLRSIHREVLSRLVCGGCASVADLCCGTGALTGMVERNGMTATGVDISPAMLGVAVRKHPARFIRADSAALPFRDGSYDGAAISFSLHEKTGDTARDVLFEARRIVRPGGLIVVADYRVPGLGWGRWTGRMIEAVERVAGKEHYTLFRRYMDKGGTDGFLRTAGLPGRCERIFLNGWAGVYAVAVPE